MRPRVCLRIYRLGYVEKRGSRSAAPPRGTFNGWGDWCGLGVVGNFVDFVNSCERGSEISWRLVGISDDLVAVWK